MATALSDRTYCTGDLDWLLTTAADFLVEQTSADDVIYYRLYHQALVEYLRPAERETVAQRRITRALIALAPIAGGRPDWARAPLYVRRQLARHAACGGLLEPLLHDAGFVLVNDHSTLSESIKEWAAQAEQGDRERRSKFWYITISATDPLQRAAMLEQHARQLGLDELANDVARVASRRPWETPWAHLAITEGDDGHGCPQSNNYQTAVVDTCGRTGGEPTLVCSGPGHLAVRRLTDGRPLAWLGPEHPFTRDADFGDDSVCPPRVGIPRRRRCARPVRPGRQCERGDGRIDR